MIKNVVTLGFEGGAGYVVTLGFGSFGEPPAASTAAIAVTVGGARIAVAALEVLPPGPTTGGGGAGPPYVRYTEEWPDQRKKELAKRLDRCKRRGDEVIAALAAAGWF